VGSVAPDLVLQSGSVINAQVLKVLSADLVRIAISSLSIDVLSEVPLKEGQALQLAVSQTKDGIRLAMVGQGSDATGDAVTLSPDAMLDAATTPSTTAPSRNVLAPVERAAVTSAAQNAATVQQSLAPLFANLGALAATGSLPPRMQQAVAQVLAQQTRLDQSLDGGDIKNAFERSGLFFEASLAMGTASSAAGVPDLKAALIVLRQTLQSSLGTDAPPPASTAAGQVAAHPAPTPGLAPIDLDIEEILLPQARLPVADDLVAPGTIGRGPSNVGPAAGATLNLLQELGNAARPNAAVASDVTVHTNTPPPPFRGALPSAQPVALPSIAPDTPLPAAAHHLLGDTDAALARQTLLQVASLPDRIDGANPQIDTSSPRWQFEIPFATQQGTALAQFEISRDGGGVETEDAKRIWRARFSLDVEPAGPVHALISLVGDKTSVRMWAERPATAAQLRAGVPQLSRALSRAELLPGDIVIQDGAPPQAAPARAGHFLDRAL
jgi:hypothetical protein